MASVSKHELRRPIKGPDGKQLRDPDTGKGLSEKTGETVWRARYRDTSAKQHSKHFARKADAQRWLDQETTKINTGSWVAPKTAKVTVGEWAKTWLVAYGTRKKGTVRQAEVHLAKIAEEFGSRRLDSIRPSEVKSWVAKLRTDGYSASYVNALHGRLGQLYRDAIEDGLVARSPVSRRTSPGGGKQRPYVATTGQVWALHDAADPLYRPGILLAAFAGLRLSEVCGLRITDVDFMRGIIHPQQQYPADPLKTDASMAAVPIPTDLALALSKHVAEFSTDWVMADGWGKQLGPWQLQREFRRVRPMIKGLPAEFRYHDLRHYYASLLIASGCDVKIVQTRLRHASAKTTLDTYGHLWPDSDETTRAAIDSAMTARGADSENPADYLRTGADVTPLRP